MTKVILPEGNVVETEAGTVEEILFRLGFNPYEVLATAGGCLLLGDEFCEEFGLALAKERFMKTFEAYRAKMYEMIIDSAVAFGARAVYRLERSYERKKDRYDMIDELISDLRENN